MENILLLIKDAEHLESPIEREVLKLCDFGHAVFGSLSISPQDLDQRGTPEYMCPELVEVQQMTTTMRKTSKNRIRGDLIDIWCLGILLFEFLVGEPPIKCPVDQKTRKHLNIDLYYHEVKTQLIESLIPNEVVSCLEFHNPDFINPDNPYGMEVKQITNLMNLDAKDLICKMCQKEPFRRIPLSGMREHAFVRM